MAFDEAFVDFMPLTVTVNPAIEGQYDQYATPILTGNVKSYRARQEVKDMRTANMAGEEVTSTMQIYLACQDRLKIEDRITLPSWINVQDKPIIGVRNVDDEDGPHHVVIFF